MTIETDTPIKRTTDQVSCAVDDDVVVMYLPTGQYFSIDLVGSRIWQLLEHPGNAEQLVAVLSEEFDAAPQRCLEDTLTFLRQLAQWGLIERAT